jgi:hypothetical protein
VAIAELNGHRIVDWDSFDDECAAVFGFPDFYGRNTNAWIDCLTYVRRGDGMSRYELGPDEPLVIHVAGVKEMRARAPEMLDALVDCVAFVNLRQIEMGEAPALHLVLR